jgi:RHS repeat-associated protein
MYIATNDGSNPGWGSLDLVQNVQNGIYANQGGFSQYFTYSPNSNFFGLDTFRYRYETSPGQYTASAWVSIAVIPRDGAQNAGATCPVLGQPVNATNGNVWLQQRDYSLPGIGEQIEINRFYNSIIQTSGLFGFGWSTQYDESIELLGDKMVRHNQPDGRAEYFGRVDTSLPFTPLMQNVFGSVATSVDGTFTLTRKDGSTRKFSSMGKLLSLKDTNANETTLAYNGSGQLIAVTDPAGRTLTLTPNSNGTIAQISDSIGVIADYEYNANPSTLKTVTYSDGSKFEFVYTTSGGKTVLATVKDALTNVVEHHEYDTQGRATTSERHGGVEKLTFNYSRSDANGVYTEVTDALGHLSKYYVQKLWGTNLITRTEGLCSCGGTGSEVTLSTYDLNDSFLVLKDRTDALGRKTLFTYDNDRNVTQIEEKLGSSSLGIQKWTYNSRGQILTYKDRVDSSGSNNTAVFTYDSNGNLLTATNALGKTTTLAYPTTNNKGLPDSVTDARNKITKFKWFSGSGLLLELEDANGKKTNFTYDARGRADTITNPLGHVTDYNYFDDTQRKVEMIYPNLDKISYKFDIRRTLESITNERGKVTTYEFDPQYRLKKITDPLGHIKEFGYDLMSFMTSYTDPLGKVTNYAPDDFGRLKEIEYPAAVSGGTRLKEKFYYDKTGRLTQVTDTANRDTTYGYDDVTRTTTVTNAEGEVTTTKYNLRFQTTEVKDALNQTYTFGYDAMGRLLSQTRAGASTSFVYDDVGNQTKRTDYAGRVTNYIYDNLNRLEKIEYEAGPNNASKQESTYSYDDISRLISATNENGTVTFGYDNLGRLTSTADVFGQALAYEYDRTTSVNQKRLKLNGTLYATYNFDDAERLSNIVNASDNSTISFGYDSEDKLTSRVYPNGVTTTYEYFDDDTLKRLKDFISTATLFDRQYTYNNAHQISSIVDASGTRTFGYDRVDRLKTVTGSATESYSFDDVGNRTSSHLSVTYGYQSGQFNQLISTGSATYGYDANGNIATKSEGSNFWRYGWDHENRLVTASTRKNSVRYKYDALGRRIERNLQFGRETSKFTYDGDDILLDDNAGTLTKYLNGDGIDNKLRATTGSNASYFLADHLGSTNGLADDTGSVTASASYDSFGNPLNTSFPSRYQFTGREFDSFTGLQYSRARWYDPKIGRFISEDPIGFAGGINLYGYVGNRAVDLVDPFGLFPSNYGDNPFDLLPNGFWNGLAYAGSFAAGFGDHVTTVPFTGVKLTKEVRKLMGSDGTVDECSAVYSAGGWAGLAWEIAFGGAGGLRAAGTKGVGKEFSHWIPTRAGGPRSLWNGNFVTISEHALSDPFRYRFMPRSWKSANPLPSVVTQQWNRIPKVYKGVAISTTVGASQISEERCGCE